MDEAREALYAGLDVGGTFLKGALLDGEGRLLGKLKQPTRKDSPSSLLDQFAAMVAELAGGRPPATVLRALGVGLPGIVDREGRVRVAPNVPALDGLALGAELKARTGVPSFAANDANVAALAEAWRGAGRGADSVLMVTLGTGVGGAVVVNRRIWTGHGGYAGEIGHIQVEPGGVPCGCGSWGCLETIVGNRGWGRRAAERLAAGRASSLSAVAEIDPKAVVAAAAAGDALALELLDETARALAVGIAAALQLLNVERVLLAGGVSNAGDILLDRVRAQTRLRSFPQVFADATIDIAQLGSDAGVIGAGTLALAEAGGASA